MDGWVNFKAGEWLTVEVKARPLSGSCGVAESMVKFFLSQGLHKAWAPAGMSIIGIQVMQAR